MTKGKRWKEIEILYSIGIILVLIGHSHSSDWSKFEGTVLYYVIEFVYLFHMPLFFFISGFLFINSKSLEKSGLKNWIRDKTLRLLTPYTFWTLLALVPKYYFENHGMDGFDFNYLVKVLLCPRAGVWGHFWFLPVMLITYFTFALLRMLINDDIKYFLVSFVLSIVLFFLPISTLILGLSDVKNAFIYFSIGMIIRNSIGDRDIPDNKYTRAIFILVGFSFLAFSVIVYLVCTMSVVLALLVALLMILSCWSFSEIIPSNKTTEWLNKYNFTIYIFSWLFQSVLMAVCDKLDFAWWITFFLMFLIGLSGPALVIYMYSILSRRFSLLNNTCFRAVLGLRLRDK